MKCSNLEFWSAIGLGGFLLISWFTENIFYGLGFLFLSCVLCALTDNEELDMLNSPKKEKRKKSKKKEYEDYMLWKMVNKRR